MLHFAECPLDEARSRLVRRNAAVAATKARLLAEAEAETKAKAAAAAAAASKGDADADADTDTAESAESARSFQGDDLNLEVPLSSFDEWRGLLEPPGEDERPVVHHCGSGAQQHKQQQEPAKAP